jgi:hypothetical protein
MYTIQKVKRKSVAYNTLILLAAITLSTAVATDALAVGRGGGGDGAPRGNVSHMDSGYVGPLVEPIPSMPPPVFNPSSPYTLPESPETPVSPASPGSIFGNG